MKVLILGSTGLAGQSFYKLCESKGFETLGLARKNADICLDISDPSSLCSALSQVNPDLVINSSALTDINTCDSQPSLCWSVNTIPLYTLSKWSKTYHKPLLQISTDHFYKGAKSAHSENEEVSLFNQYAASKYSAESLALTSPFSLVLRTSILGFRGWENPTLVEWVINSLKKETSMNVFYDAWSSSIDVDTFARISLQLVLKKGLTGLYNLAADEVYSKSSLISEIANQIGGYHAKLVPTSILRTLPNRANSLGLDVGRVKSVLDEDLPSMTQVVSSLIENYIP